MKPAVMTCLSALVALSLTGCPIYPADDLCRSDWDCAEGYLCNRASGSCVQAGPLGCTRPLDCVGPSEVCSRTGLCMIGSCHLSEVGCVAGYTCVGRGPEMAWTCVPTGEANLGGAPSVEDAGAGGTVTGGGAPSDAGAGGTVTGGGASTAAPDAG